MILTCPSCGTQYAVKDGAIPPAGRQVRCASCKHAWHQDPEGSPAPGAEEPAEVMSAPAENVPDAGFDDRRDDVAEAPVSEPAAYSPIDPVAPPGEAMVEDAPASSVGGEWTPPVEREPVAPAAVEPAAVERVQPDVPPEEPAYDDDFSPFTTDEDDEPTGRSPLLKLLLIALLIAALAAAFWFLAPPEWKERVGIAAAGETPLQLMMTHSDRQKLASGNELLAVSGRVINPTDEQQNVPPISAQLRSSSGKLVYSWTIAPPARTLPPGASATFNSAEVNVPAGGDELTITLGPAKT